MEKDLYQQFFDNIKDSDNVLILCSKPDGDSISSSSSLNILIRKLGKNATSFSAYPIPDYLNFLNPNEIVKNVELSKQDLSIFDLVILVDSVSLDRCTNNQSFLFQKNLKVIAIDHHLSVNDSEIKNNLELISPQSESTCGIILDIFQYFKEAQNIDLIDKDTAFLLYGGIVSDTDYFAYANVNQKTFERAAKLMAYGFDPAQIILVFRETLSLKAFRFIQRNINRVNINEEKRYAYLKIKKEDLSDEDRLPTVNEAVNFLNRAILKILDEIDFCFILREVSSNKSSVAMRLHNNGNSHDLSKIAGNFGGGGHKQSAGAIVEKDIDKFEIEFTNYLDKLIKKS